MNNQFLDFWQNAISDIMDSNTQSEYMDKIAEQSLSNLEEFTSMMQKMTNLDMFSPSVAYFNTIASDTFDFKKKYQDYLNFFGLVSMDEYRSLVNKFEQLIKENETLKKNQGEQGNKSTELNKTVASQKKKLTSMGKTIDDQKKKLTEQKKLEGNLKKEVSKITQSADKLKKEVNEKEKIIKELQAKQK